MFEFGRKRRRAIAVMVAWGLLVQLLLPAVFASARADQPAANASDLQTVVICTGQGFVRVTVDADGNIVEDENGQPLSADFTDCPLCPSPSGGSAILRTGGSELAAPRETPAARIAVDDTRLDSSGFHVRLRARAPPR